VSALGSIRSTSPGGFAGRLLNNQLIEAFGVPRGNTHELFKLDWDGWLPHDPNGGVPTANRRKTHHQTRSQDRLQGFRRRIGLPL
jgi:hypothetical protein